MPERWAVQPANEESRRMSMQVWEIYGVDSSGLVTRTIAHVFDGRLAEEIVNAHNKSLA